MLVDNYSTMIYLEPGKHVIVPSKRYSMKNSCGIIPLVGKCKLIETTGLKWNLGYDSPFKSLDFLEFISCSNDMEEDIVTIANSDPVVWTTTLNESILPSKVN